MSLVKICEEILQELQDKNIKYPDPLFIKMKMVKTTIEGISCQVSGVKKGD